MRMMKYFGTPIFSLYEKYKVTGEGKDQKVEAIKYLIRGDWNGRVSVWNLSNIKASVSLKESDYEMSLCKFWKENVKSESENVNSNSLTKNLSHTNYFLNNFLM